MVTRQRLAKCSTLVSPSLKIRTTEPTPPSSLTTASRAVFATATAAVTPRLCCKVKSLHHTLPDVNTTIVVIVGKLEITNCDLKTKGEPMLAPFLFLWVESSKDVAQP